MYTYNSKVLRIIDGDTLEVEFDLGFGISFKEKVRLYGINAYEIHGVNQEKGIKAKELVESLIPIGSYVIIKTHKDTKEKFGRYLGEIVLSDGRTINTILVTEGLAIPFMV